MDLPGPWKKTSLGGLAFTTHYKQLCAVSMCYILQIQMPKIWARAPTCLRPCLHILYKCFCSVVVSFLHCLQQYLSPPYWWYIYDYWSIQKRDLLLLYTQLFTSGYECMDFVGFNCSQNLIFQMGNLIVFFCPKTCQRNFCHQLAQDLNDITAELLCRHQHSHQTIQQNHANQSLAPYKTNYHVCFATLSWSVVLSCPVCEPEIV